MHCCGFIPKIIEKAKDSYFTYVGQEVDPEQVEELSEPFRGYSFYHKYSEKQLQSLKKLLQHLGNKHNIDIRQGLAQHYHEIPSRGKANTKAFDMFGTKQCYDTSGIWSHTNVNKEKVDVAPQEELIEMLLKL